MFLLNIVNILKVFASCLLQCRVSLPISSKCRHDSSPYFWNLLDGKKVVRTVWANIWFKYPWDINSLLISTLYSKLSPTPWKMSNVWIQIVSLSKYLLWFNETLIAKFVLKNLKNSLILLNGLGTGHCFPLTR